MHHNTPITTKSGADTFINDLKHVVQDCKSQQLLYNESADQNQSRLDQLSQQFRTMFDTSAK